MDCIPSAVWVDGRCLNDLFFLLADSCYNNDQVTYFWKEMFENNKLQEERVGSLIHILLHGLITSLIFRHLIMELNFYYHIPI